MRVSASILCFLESMYVCSREGGRSELAVSKSELSTSPMSDLVASAVGRPRHGKVLLCVTGYRGLLFRVLLIASEARRFDLGQRHPVPSIVCCVFCRPCADLGAFNSG